MYRHDVRTAKKHDGDEGADRCNQQSIVDAKVDHAAHRQLGHPAQIEVDNVDSVEEALVRVRVGDVRNFSELDGNERLAGTVGAGGWLADRQAKQKYVPALVMSRNDYLQH